MYPRLRALSDMFADPATKSLAKRPHRLRGTPSWLRTERSRNRTPRLEQLEGRAMLTLPEFSVVAYNAGEGSHVLVDVTLSEPSPDPTYVDLAIEGITATPTDDYYLDGANPGVF